MRVLDLGCGRASSSIFLAKEFGLQVWATDLWIKAEENWERVRAANLEEDVFPIHAEAHALPFANEFFDAVVSMDAYHYFGTDDLYLGYMLRFLKTNGQLGIKVPGLRNDFVERVPDHLEKYWHWEFHSFHSPAWWRRHWEKTGLVTVMYSDFDAEGWQQWMKWEEVIFEQEGNEYARQEAAMLEVDAGRNLGFTQVVARKTAS
jgi:cyclopropane fatty-acyl-phospholipid synthase-like methyltransferase